MPQKKLVLDGLWYCLCPSLNLLAPNRFGIPLTKGKRGLPSPALPPRRCYSSGEPAGDNERRSAPRNTPNIDPATEQQDVSRTVAEKGPHKRHARKETGVARAPKTPPALKKLSGLPTVNLEAKLQELSAKVPKIKTTMRILRILVKDRHVRPGVRHYRALILANTDAERGSPETLRGLLSEMERNGVPADSGTLHAALQVLAVHPDYLPRQEILRTLRDRWLPLSPAGWHYVVAGLLRETQFELALDHIEQMARKDIVIEDWLHSLFVYNLCEFGELDEVLKMMRSRADQGHDISLNLWLHALEVASAAVHHEATSYVWTQVVHLGYLRPPRSICSNVLVVAAQTGDTELAEMVVRFLAENNMPLESQDYANLAGTHAEAGNLIAAFEVLCSMHKAGFTMEDSSTQPVLASLIQAKVSPSAAWDLLKQVKSMKHDIPPGCAKVVFQLCENDALDDPFAVDDAVSLYKDLYCLCPGGADISIYNTLVNMCRRAKNRDVAMFIVKEMSLLGAVPDRTTFERLILMCLDAGNFQSAYMYFQDMQERGFDPSKQAQEEICNACSGTPDTFAVRLRYHPKIRGDLVRAKDPGDALVPKDRIKNPSPLDAKRPPPPRPSWMSPGMPHEDRRRTSTWRRKFKRRQAAIARSQEEERWMDYEPGGVHPQVKPDHD